MTKVIIGVDPHKLSATIEVVDRHSAWTYSHSSPLARKIKGHIAFWPGAVTIESV